MRVGVMSGPDKLLTEILDAVMRLHRAERMRPSETYGAHSSQNERDGATEALLSLYNHLVRRYAAPNVEVAVRERALDPANPEREKAREAEEPEGWGHREFTIAFWRPGTRSMQPKLKYGEPTPYIEDRNGRILEDRAVLKFDGEDLLELASRFEVWPHLCSDGTWQLRMDCRNNRWQQM